jgi:hypothetical protein
MSCDFAGVNTRAENMPSGNANALAIAVIVAEVLSIETNAPQLWHRILMFGVAKTIFHIGIVNSQQPGHFRITIRPLMLLTCRMKKAERIRALLHCESNNRAGFLVCHFQHFQFGGINGVRSIIKGSTPLRNGLRMQHY